MVGIAMMAQNSFGTGNPRKLVSPFDSDGN